MTRGRRVVATLGALALGGAGAFLAAGISGADVTDPVWNCRASVVYLEQELVPVSQLARIEPIVANGDANATTPDRDQCVDDDAGAPTIEIPGTEGSPLDITADAVYARTRIEPDIAAARDQYVASGAGAEKLNIDLGDGALVIDLNAINSFASATCRDGKPVLFGASQVLGLSIGGSDVIDVKDYEDIDLSPLARLQLNEQVKTDDALVQRAVHLEVLPDFANDRPGINVVLGETKVEKKGLVCAPPTPPPTVTDTQTQTQTVTTPPQTVTDTQTQTQTQTVSQPATTQTVTQTVTTPSTTPATPAAGTQPSGATEVDLGDVRGVSNASPCKRAKFGRQVGLVGTNGPDRVTGTNRSDRIFTRAGDDRVSAGRGNDCVEAGTGNDQLTGDLGTDYLFGDKGSDRESGGPGADRLYGGPGGDVLIGASGNDRIYGGAGNDFIHTGFGRDRVFAGSGNDTINAATAGNRQYVYCGAGYDIVRLQFYDRAFDCERVIRVP